jgi:hypothetical protein
MSQRLLNIRIESTAHAQGKLILVGSDGSKNAMDGHCQRFTFPYSQYTYFHNKNINSVQMNIKKY